MMYDTIWREAMKAHRRREEETRRAAHRYASRIPVTNDLLRDAGVLPPAPEDDFVERWRARRRRRRAAFAVALAFAVGVVVGVLL